MKKTYLKWNDELLVNIESIDKQHKTLYDFINNLHETMISGHSNEAIQPAIVTLINYVKEHFTQEEEFMSSIEYPGIIEQRKEHL